MDYTVDVYRESELINSLGTLFLICTCPVVQKKKAQTLFLIEFSQKCNTTQCCKYSVLPIACCATYISQDVIW